MEELEVEVAATSHNTTKSKTTVSSSSPSSPSAPSAPSSSSSSSPMGWRTKLTISILVLVVIIVAPVLFGKSFKYIEWNEYALKKNTASNDVDYSTVHENGRYFWGINYAAVKFTRTIINVNFDDEKGGEGSLAIFTDTGLEIRILCSFQYQLIKEEIPAMFVSFGNTYPQQVVSVARSILKNTAPTFLVEQYYRQRDVVTKTFYDALQSNLRISAKVALVSFQLRHVYLADQIVQKLLNIQVQLQVNLKEQYVQSAALIRKETEAQVATISANASVIISQANSQADLTRAVAKSTAFKTKETARKEGLSQLYESLNITTSQLKLSFIYATGLSSTNAKLLVDTKGALVSIDGNKN